ncbi:MAG: N-6 DNA methylase [Candidatus Omnitrophica bacterium]|nr:N-6 DNA methylase [Candidatus Omnitrophota bacterium]
MLTNGTKRLIDTARDILVGKLPDPKSQVEQITIALIYKFMDDMDKQAEELGGKPKFFTGEYGKYAWSKIFDPRVSGHELVGLYGEAIQRMNQNPNIPQLFRNIFKNAYLPYRDPETLKSFLKTIGEFEYDHSEKLGDSFEYLLSVMGSQGDAGQFRTPRHIIDFMVEVVAPCKNETILDPACGTAGFLISSYKHILEKNKKDGRINLTHDQRKRLIANFSGYDISPDMVRLSLANMYLHGFQNPKIYEYDTLTSEEKWQETFDVILANPPFMSPKGGIKPHKRFSVQSKRSEVLFVDYMAEHLNPNGRAGIIVPEGIIFQSGTAYRKLRKMLVEHSLYAVVSLPAGVFNPYSGVKTSVLLLDKNLVKKTDKLLFVKVNNDGYGLGAQRREIKENDLPMVLEIIKKYKQSIVGGKEVDFTVEEAKLATLIEKRKVAESGDYNLGGDRYKDALVYSGKWDFVDLGDVCEIKTGRKDVNQGNPNGEYPFFTCAKEHTFSDEYSFDTEAILVAGNGDVGAVQYYKGKFEAYQRTYVLSDFKGATARYLFFVLESTLKETVSKQKLGNTMPYIKLGMLKNYKIPLPPFEVQKQIVTELDSYQKVVEGARQVVENYKPHIDIDPEWEMVELGKIAEINPKKSQISDLDQELEVSFVPMADINENRMNFVPKTKKKIGEVFKGYTYFSENDVLLAKVTPCFENGKAGIARGLVNEIGFGSSEFYVLRAGKRIRPEWIYYNIILSSFREIGTAKMTGTGGLQRVPKDFVYNWRIPCPKINVQDEVIREINQEQNIVFSNRQLIEIYEQKIKNRIATVWGD